LHHEGVDGLGGDAVDLDVLARQQSQLARQVARDRHHKVAAPGSELHELHDGKTIKPNPRLVNFKSDRARVREWAILGSAQSAEGQGTGG